MSKARILAIADLHFPSSSSLVWRLAQLLKRVNLDAIVLAGDFLDTPVESYVRKLFKLIRRHYKGIVLDVWGNHEHYLTKNKIEKMWNSFDQLRMLNRLFEEYEVVNLDSGSPVEVKGITILGGVGWYDYSYGPSRYAIEDYERCNPYGADLVTLRNCLRDPMRSLCPQWWRNDCLYIKLPITNKEYVETNVKRLEKLLEHARPPAVVVLHHSPKKELLKYTGKPEQDFNMAYAGSPRLGEVIERYNHKIVAVVYGHLHEFTLGRVAYLNGTPYINAYPNYPGAQGFTIIEPIGNDSRVNVTII